MCFSQNPTAQHKLRTTHFDTNIYRIGQNVGGDFGEITLLVYLVRKTLTMKVLSLDCFVLHGKDPCQSVKTKTGAKIAKANWL